MLELWIATSRKCLRCKQELIVRPNVEQTNSYGDREVEDASVDDKGLGNDDESRQGSDGRITANSGLSYGANLQLAVLQ
jgi:hypothetical protein